jgi:predicted Zn-dependent peptidase
MIAAIVRDGVTDRELQKAKNGARADYISGFKTNVGVANQLGYYEVIFGDYRESLQVMDGIASVTADDVRRAAEQYLDPRGRTVVTLIPE